MARRAAGRYTTICGYPGWLVPTYREHYEQFPVGQRERRLRPGGGPGRTVRLYFLRFTGPDFSERDRALLTLIRPHLHQAFLDAERRRASVAPLTPRQTDLLPLVADGHTNTAIARRVG
jgi:hypothetical protein